jgi:hypothetical protein
MEDRRNQDIVRLTKAPSFSQKDSDSYYSIYLEYLRAEEELALLKKNGVDETDLSYVALISRISQLTQKLSEFKNSAFGPSNEPAYLNLAKSKIGIEKWREELVAEQWQIGVGYQGVLLHDAPAIAQAPKSPKMLNLLVLGAVGFPLAFALLSFPMTGLFHLITRGR